MGRIYDLEGGIIPGLSQPFTGSGGWGSTQHLGTWSSSPEAGRRAYELGEWGPRTQGDDPCTKPTVSAYIHMKHCLEGKPHDIGWDHPLHRREKGQVGIDTEKERKRLRQQWPGWVALLRIFQIFHLLLLNPDQNVLKVHGVDYYCPQTEFVSHSLHGLSSEALYIQLDTVREFYSPDVRGGSGGRVWVWV